MGSTAQVAPPQECLERMIEAEIRLWAFHNKLDECEVIDIINTPELGLLDYVLSALGFPESDEQTEEDLKNDNPTFYCRDWLVDKLGEVVAEGGTAREYIEWAKEQLHPMYEPPS